MFTQIKAGSKVVMDGFNMSYGDFCRFVDSAADAALTSSAADRLEREAEEEGQRWHDEREAAAHLNGSWA